MAENNTCLIPNCSHPVFPLADDDKCIFHTETGKIKGYDEEGSPIFIKPEERDEIAEKVVDAFIKKFSKILRQRKRDKKKLKCNNFIFPHVMYGEWLKMWNPVMEQMFINSSEESIFYRINLDFPVEFQNAKFGGEVDFVKAKFNNKVSFTEVEFKGEADFMSAEFAGEVSFNSAKFNSMINFIRAKFSEEAHFSKAKFKKMAGFSGAKFSKKGYFSLAEFNDIVGFIDVEFCGGVDFNETQFHGIANFVRTKFSNKVNFKSVNFNDTTNFIKAEFSDKVDFSRGGFSGKVDFSEVKFSSEANFNFVKFNHFTIFYNTIIVRKLNFSNCEFSSHIRFRNINRLDELEIKNIKKTQQIKESPSKGILKLQKSSLKEVIKIVGNETPPVIFLRDVRFWENGTIILEDFDISKISFWLSDFYYIKKPCLHFIRVQWHKNKILLDDIFKREGYQEYKKLRKKEKKGEELSNDEKELKEIYKEIYDPIEQTQNKVEELERCYRQIRLIYESQGEYADAGDFYLHEMRVRGKRLKGFLKILHYLYGIISKYGESVGRAFGWLFAVLISSAPGFVYKETELSKIGEIISTSNYRPFSSIKHIFSIFSNSIFTGLNYIILGKIEAPNILSPWQLGIIRVFGLSILTLLLLAIRRRFRR